MISLGDEEEQSSQESCKPIGIAFHESFGALARSSESCALCAIIQAGVETRDNAFDDAAQNGREETNEIMRLKRSISSKVQLWLTKPIHSVPGFFVWAQHPRQRRELSLVATIGFSPLVDFGMTPVAVCGRISSH